MSAEGCWKGGELTFGEECWVVMGADQQQHPPADSWIQDAGVGATDLTGSERDATSQVDEVVAGRVTKTA